MDRIHRVPHRVRAIQKPELTSLRNAVLIICIRRTCTWLGCSIDYREDVRRRGIEDSRDLTGVFLSAT